MTIMITEVYDALLSAGADETKARTAASTLAAYDNEIASMRTDIRILQWMVGSLFPLLLAILLKLFLK